LGPDTTKYLKPPNTREHYVKYDNRMLARKSAFDALLTGVDGLDAKAFPSQELRNQLTQLDVVVYDEDPLRRTSGGLFHLGNRLHPPSPRQFSSSVYWDAGTRRCV
jgi:hypothetical protein